MGRARRRGLAARVIRATIAFTALAALSLAWPDDAAPSIAFAATSPAGAGARGAGLDIYALEPDGSTTQLTRALGADSMPAWSPDGKQIAFVSERDGSPRVYVMRADGSSQHALVQNSLTESGSPAWSPDGKRVAFEGREQAQGAFAVYVVGRDGKQPQRVSGGGTDARQPAWRPDGQRLALAVKRADGWYLCTAQPDGAGLQPILKDAASKSEVPDIAWSPDGSKIGFASDRDDAKGDVYVVNADGSGLHRLTQSPGRDDRPTWSADGSQILFQSDRGGALSLYAMDADGSPQTRVRTGELGGTCYVAWNPQAKGHLMVAQAPAGETPGPAPAAPGAPAKAPPAAGNLEFQTTLARGVGAIQAGKSADAIAAFQKAQQLVPGSPQPDWWLARTYLSQTPPDYENAVSAFAGAIEKDAKQPELGGEQKAAAYGFIGKVYLANAKDDPQRLDRAVQMLTAAVAADQNDASAAYDLARALARKGDGQHAIGALKIAALAEQRTGKTGTVIRAKTEPDFDALRNDPQFADVVANAAEAPPAPAPSPTPSPGTAPQPPGPGPKPPEPAPAEAAGQGPARLLAWTSYRDNNPDVFVMDLQRGEPINLTRNPASDEQPAISPNRGQIAFVSDRDGNKEIYVVDLDGKNLRRLTNSPGDDTHPRWTPDGKKIVFCSERGGNKEIWIMDADGGYPTNLTHDANIDQDPDIR
jgi:Tol biopolymer transport system component